MTQADLIAAWRSLDTTPGLGRKKLAALALALTEAGLTARDLIGSEPERLRALGLSPKLADAASASIRSISDHDSSNPVVVPGMGDYPMERLKGRIPPPVVIRYQGNARLLNTPAIAVGGSRDTPPRVLDFVGELARAAATAGLNVVSGLARGVDRTAHTSALEAGGTTTAVLASGLDEWASSADSLGPHGDDLLVVSEFEDGAAWSPHRAMQRNETIASLSDVVVVAAAGSSGGSLSMGRTCLKSGMRLVVPAELVETSPGLPLLVDEGAEPIACADFEWLGGLRNSRATPTPAAPTLF